MTKFSVLEDKFAADIVRKFETSSEAAEFFHLENADPPRIHYQPTVDRIMLRSFIYGAVKDGACSINGRDNGWDTVDSEGWYRFRYCRHTNIAEMVIPSKGKIRWISWRSRGYPAHPRFHKGWTDLSI